MIKKPSGRTVIVQTFELIPNDPSRLFSGDIELHIHSIGDGNHSLANWFTQKMMSGEPVALRLEDTSRQILITCQVEKTHCHSVIDDGE